VRLPTGGAYHPRCPFAVERCREEDPALVSVDTPQHTAACIRWQAVAESVGTRRPAEAL
jgi:ABC-type dipeptide/oligopeptide/nickel transport system ATPase component